MSYTRKRIGERKVNPDGLLEIDLHRMLNRIDVEKDAVKCKESIYEGYDNFTKCADALFGEMPKSSYEKSLDNVTNAINRYSIYKNEPVEIGPIHALTSGVIPSYIKYIIQDAGIAPKQYLPYLQYVVTPGSYLDPASRPQGDIMSEFGTTLDYDEFISLGFSAVQSLKSVLHPDKSCIIQLNLQDPHAIQTVFHPNFSVKSGSPYFAGNTTKNQWFNDSRTYSQKEGARYIICKELGDILQAYYGMKFIERINIDPKKVCLFTNDTNLFLRCQLLNLQTIRIIKCGDKSNFLYHYPVMSDVTSSFIEMYNSNLQAHNANVVKGINRVLRKNRFYRCNGEIVRFSSRSSIARILTQCIMEIQRRTEEFKSLSQLGASVNEYRKIAKLYMANEIFTLDVINHGMKSLFIQHSPGAPVFEPSFGNILSGGGATHSENDEITIEQSQLPEYEMRYTNFTLINTYGEQTDPTLLMLNTIYKYHNTYNSEWSENRKLFATELLFNMLYMLFDYYCYAIWDQSIIKELIEDYDTGFLGSMTYTKFKRMIDWLMNKYLPPKGIEEEIFEKYYGPKDNEGRVLEILASLQAMNATPQLPKQTRKHIRVTARKTRRKPRHQ